MRKILGALLFVVIGLAGCQHNKPAPQNPPAHAVDIHVNWDHVVRVSNSTPTLQVVVNPPLRRGSSIHNRVLRRSTTWALTMCDTFPGFPTPSWVWPNLSL